MSGAGPDVREAIVAEALEEGLQTHLGDALEWDWDEEAPNVPSVRDALADPIATLVPRLTAAVLAALDAAASADSADPADGLSEDEREALVESFWGFDSHRRTYLTGLCAPAVERILAARQRPTQQAATDRVECWCHLIAPCAACEARAVIAAAEPQQVATDRVVEALNEAADALEGTLGTASDPPRDLWEFRQWLRDRARAIAAARDGAES